jgi:WD40 repeat protein
MEYSTAFGTDTDAVGVAVGQKDTSLIFAGALDGVVKVQSGGSMAKQTHKTKLPFQVSSIALSPDEKLLAVGGADAKVHIFAVGDGDLQELKVRCVVCNVFRVLSFTVLLASASRRLHLGA